MACPGFRDLRQNSSVTVRKAAHWPAAPSAKVLKTWDKPFSAYLRSVL